MITISSFLQTLLLTSTGDVYQWGDARCALIQCDNRDAFPIPVKLPLSDIISVSTSSTHSLALSADNRIYQWDGSSFTHRDPSFKLKQVFAASEYSLALTADGNLVHWRLDSPILPVEGLDDVCFVTLEWNDFVAIDTNNRAFFARYSNFGKFRISTLKIEFNDSEIMVNSCSLGESFIAFVGINNKVYLMTKKQNKFQPEQFTWSNAFLVDNIDNIKSVTAIYDQFVALANDGNVYGWSVKPFASPLFLWSEPRLINFLSNIESIFSGVGCLFAVKINSNSAFAWGFNSKGQLGTGDLIDVPRPINVFGSEITGIKSLKQSNSIFFDLIRTIFIKYFKYLNQIFNGHPYVIARFKAKLSVSSKFRLLCTDIVENFNSHEYLRNPSDLSQLRSPIAHLEVTKILDENLVENNTNVEEIFLNTNDLSLFNQFLPLFPNLNTLSITSTQSNSKRNILNLGRLTPIRNLFLDWGLISTIGSLPPLLSKLVFKPPTLSVIFSLSFGEQENLKHLEISAIVYDFPSLPTSLVKLSVASFTRISTVDFSNLVNLKELSITHSTLSKRIVQGRINLPPSITKLQLQSDYLEFGKSFFLPNLKEFVLKTVCVDNFNVNNFPKLNFICFNELESRQNFECSALCPSLLYESGLIESFYRVKGGNMVKLKSNIWIYYPFCVSFEFFNNLFEFE
ncbi:hypothetical protein P9112_000016 [Eukaryota sp. TZLM1-RC]